MKKNLYILVILVVYVFPVLAAEWKQIDEKEYIDVSSIQPYYASSVKKPNKEKAFYVKTLNNKSKYFNDMEKNYNDKVWYKITKNIIDCDNKTMALKSSAAYNNSGELLDSYTVEDSFLERKDIIPETKGDYWHNIVCDYNNKSLPDLKQKQADETISNEELDEGFIKNGIDFKSYMDEVQKSIKMCWDPPQESRSKRVVLLFSIAKDGNLVGNIKVKKSSGRTEADNAAIRAVNDAAPFKPLPKKFNGKSVDIQFSFDYNVINKAEI